MSFIVLVGKGLIHAVELPIKPSSGVEFNIGSPVVAGGPGRFRITERLGTIELFPHWQIARLGDIPAGQQSVPWVLTTC